MLFRSIRIAKEANGEEAWPGGVDWTWEELERFAQLVAQAQRQKVAQWMIKRSYATGHGDSVEDLLKELEWQAKERGQA